MSNGEILDLRPATRCLHELSIVRGTERRIIGRYEHAPNSEFIAADTALSEAEKEGLRQIAHVQRSYRMRFANLAELRPYVRAHVKGRLSARSEKLLTEQWSNRQRGTWLELRERFQVNLLRQRRRSPKVGPRVGSCH